MSQKSSSPLILGVILAVILIGGSIFVLNLPQNSSDTSNATSSTSAVQSSPVAQQDEANSDTSMAAQYADGLYVAAGDYFAPGPMSETVQVELTLQNDVITQVATSTQSQSQTSEFWLTQFSQGIVDVVVGKDIDQISEADVAVVNGSSLTGEGFIKALEQIKQQAQ